MNFTHGACSCPACVPNKPYVGDLSQLHQQPDAAWRSAMEAAEKAVAALTAENEKLRAENESLMAARPGDTKLRTDRERQCYSIGYDRGIASRN